MMTRYSEVGPTQLDQRGGVPYPHANPQLAGVNYEAQARKVQQDLRDLIGAQIGKAAEEIQNKFWNKRYKKQNERLNEFLSEVNTAWIQLGTEEKQDDLAEVAARFEVIWTKVLFYLQQQDVVEHRGYLQDYWQANSGCRYDVEKHAVEYSEQCDIGGAMTASPSIEALKGVRSQRLSELETRNTSLQRELLKLPIDDVSVYTSLTKRRGQLKQRIQSMRTPIEAQHKRIQDATLMPLQKGIAEWVGRWPQAPSGSDSQGSSLIFKQALTFSASQSVTDLSAALFGQIDRSIGKAGDEARQSALRGLKAALPDNYVTAQAVVNATDTLAIDGFARGAFRRFFGMYGSTKIEKMTEALKAFIKLALTDTDTDKVLQDDFDNIKDKKWNKPEIFKQGINIARELAKRADDKMHDDAINAAKIAVESKIAASKASCESDVVKPFCEQQKARWSEAEADVVAEQSEVNQLKRDVQKFNEDQQAIQERIQNTHENPWVEITRQLGEDLGCQGGNLEKFDRVIIKRKEKIAAGIDFHDLADEARRTLVPRIKIVALLTAYAEAMVNREAGNPSRGLIIELMFSQKSLNQICDELELDGASQCHVLQRFIDSLRGGLEIEAEKIGGQFFNAERNSVELPYDVLAQLAINLKGLGYTKPGVPKDDLLEEFSELFKPAQAYNPLAVASSIERFIEKYTTKDEVLETDLEDIQSFITSMTALMGSRLVEYGLDTTVQDEYDKLLKWSKPHFERHRCHFVEMLENMIEALTQKLSLQPLGDVSEHLQCDEDFSQVKAAYNVFERTYTRSGELVGKIKHLSELIDFNKAQQDRLAEEKLNERRQLEVQRAEIEVAKGFPEAGRKSLQEALSGFENGTPAHFLEAKNRLGTTLKFGFMYQNLKVLLGEGQDGKKEARAILTVQVRNFIPELRDFDSTAILDKHLLLMVLKAYAERIRRDTHEEGTQKVLYAKYLHRVFSVNETLSSSLALDKPLNDSQLQSMSLKFKRVQEDSLEAELMLLQDECRACGSSSLNKIFADFMIVAKFYGERETDDQRNLAAGRLQRDHVIGFLKAGATRGLYAYTVDDTPVFMLLALKAYIRNSDARKNRFARLDLNDDRRLGVAYKLYALVNKHFSSVIKDKVSLVGLDDDRLDIVRESASEVEPDVVPVEGVADAVMTVKSQVVANAAAVNLDESELVVADVKEVADSMMAVFFALMAKSVGVVAGSKMLTSIRQVLCLGDEKEKQSLLSFVKGYQDGCRDGVELNKTSHLVLLALKKRAESSASGLLSPSKATIDFSGELHLALMDALGMDSVPRVLQLSEGVMAAKVEAYKVELHKAEALDSDSDSIAKEFEGDEKPLSDILVVYHKVVHEIFPEQRGAFFGGRTYGVGQVFDDIVELNKAMEGLEGGTVSSQVHAKKRLKNFIYKKIDRAEREVIEGYTDHQLILGALRRCYDEKLGTKGEESYKRQGAVVLFNISQKVDQYCQCDDARLLISLPPVDPAMSAMLVDVTGQRRSGAADARAVTNAQERQAHSGRRAEQGVTLKEQQARREKRVAKLRKKKRVGEVMNALMPWVRPDGTLVEDVPVNRPQRGGVRLRKNPG